MEHKIALSGEGAWRLGSQDGLTQDGSVISTPSCDASAWREASVPLTVMGNLIKAGEHPNLYVGRNLESIGEAPFEQPWWYRRSFELPRDGLPEGIRLAFHGINYRGEVWLNGHKVAGEDEIFGTFRTWEFEVSAFALPGTNILAVRVTKPRPGDFRLDFADWNPRPQDRCMGLWRGVDLLLSGAVSVSKPFVRSRLDLDGLAFADLSAGVELRNHSDREVSGILRFAVEDKSVSLDVTVAAGELIAVVLDAAAHHNLHIENPRVWWPHQMGSPELYSARFDFSIGGEVSDSTNINFGIRQVSTYFNEDGHRGYIVNGHTILIRGGGWTDNMFLLDTDAEVIAQVAYVRHLGLNCIRLEGIWGRNHALYDECDRQGVLILAGWSCQWEWEGQLGKPCDEFMGAETEDEMDLVAAMTRDQVIWLRNHPSILGWIWGSDKLPRPALERRFIKVMEECDDRPYAMSAKDFTSSVTGPSGMKMRGPYDYCPPVYWYRDTRKGGAFGFNTETGPGPQPAPLESMQRMLGKDHLWPIDETWDFHCARGVPIFNSLTTFRNALDRRHGLSSGIEDFLQKSQLQAYEAMRGMFEAFAVRRPAATGVIQWMLNSAWPSMFWQLWDSYLLPNGAFYGARKACRPIQLAWDYGRREVYAINMTMGRHEGLKAKARVFDINSRELETVETVVNLGPNESRLAMCLPEPGGLTATWFLALSLGDAADLELSSNFYWLSTRDDVMDYSPVRFEHLYTPQAAFADFRSLSDLPRAKVSAGASIALEGGDWAGTIVLENNGDVIAFFMELRVVGDADGLSFLPVFLDDNYLSLLPGERRSIAVRFPAGPSGKGKPVVELAGVNVEKLHLAL